jgi:hypothetical protein
VTGALARLFVFKCVGEDDGTGSPATAELPASD